MVESCGYAEYNGDYGEEEWPTESCCDVDAYACSAWC